MKLVLCLFSTAAMTSLANVRNNDNFPRLHVKAEAFDLAHAAPNLSGKTLVQVINAASCSVKGKKVTAFQYDEERVALFMLVEDDVVASDIFVKSDGGDWESNVCTKMRVLEADWRVAPSGYISLTQALLLASAAAAAVR